MDLLRQPQRFLSTSDAAAVHTNVDIDQHADLAARRAGRRRQRFGVPRVIDRDRHTAIPGHCRKLPDLRLAQQGVMFLWCFPRLLSFAICE